jgi:hypothetical protein
MFCSGIDKYALSDLTLRLLLSYLPKVPTFRSFKREAHVLLVACSLAPILLGPIVAHLK